MIRLRHFINCALLLLLAAGIPATAQYGRPRQGGAGRNSQQAPLSQTPAVTFTGIVRGIDAKLLNIEGPETNTLLFHCSKKTKYFDGANEIKRDTIKAGDRVSVDARRGPDGSMDAVSVRIEHPKAEEATRGER
jgi:hypothetical protein